MSRLQVGGLALIIKAVNKENEGLVVELLFYDSSLDDWEVVGHSEQLDDSHCDEVGSTMWCPSRNLMPLGDKQTQDELAKQKELENV